MSASRPLKSLNVCKLRLQQEASLQRMKKQSSMIWTRRVSSASLHQQLFPTPLRSLPAQSPLDYTSEAHEGAGFWSFCLERNCGPNFLPSLSRRRLLILQDFNTCNFEEKPTESFKKFEPTRTISHVVAIAIVKETERKNDCNSLGPPVRSRWTFAFLRLTVVLHFSDYELMLTHKFTF